MCVPHIHQIRQYLNPSPLSTIYRTRTDCNKYWAPKKLARGVFYGQKEHKATLVKMLAAFSNIYDSHVGRVSTDRHRVKLTSENTQPVHSAAFGEGPSLGNFLGRNCKRCRKKTSSSWQRRNGRAHSICSKKEDGSLGFCHHYLKLDTINVPVS